MIRQLVIFHRWCIHWSHIAIFTLDYIRAVWYKKCLQNAVLGHIHKTACQGNWHSIIVTDLLGTMVMDLFYERNSFGFYIFRCGQVAVCAVLSIHPSVCWPACLHTVSSRIDEVPHCVSRSSVKLQGPMGPKNESSLPELRVPGWQLEFDKR